MKSLLAFSLLVSLSASASSVLEAQKKQITQIIAGNQVSIDKAINSLRGVQAQLRRNVNTIATLQGIENTCADTDFERLITNLAKKWEFDFVKMTTVRLESKYQEFKRNPQLEPKLSISQSEIFDTTARVAIAQKIKVCNYSELFSFDTSADFDHAARGAWQNYSPLLSYQDIVSGSYQKTMKHIVDNAPVKVQGVMRRLGPGSASYRLGKVYQVITYDKVFSSSNRYNHAELTSPIEIIKKAKNL